ncbi:MAG TPA: glycosyltransferase 87 family protein [Micromonosporaceae bacterium]|jgi:alpha-1,2-mannosyltransferase|nr:glycosyltransferase 87 family protein [Micromonosporaceae bacterium]
MYVGSVRDLAADGSLYDYAFPPTGAPFTYPPFAGLLLSPLAPLNLDVVMVSWMVATVVGVVTLAVLLAKVPGLPDVLPPALRAPAVALLLFLSSPIGSNLRFGQISFFVVLAVLVDCLRIVPPRYAGVATGIAAAVKLTPLIFIPYFWISGQRRAAVAATGTFAVCTGLAWAILPGDSARFWGTELFDVDGMGFIAIGGNQSLNGAMLRLHHPDAARTAVLATVGVAIVVLALIRAARAWRNNQPLAAAVMVGAAGLVFSPVSWTHHQLWLVFAALVPVSRRRSWNLGWAALVSAIMILPVTSVGASLPGGVVFGNAHLLLAVAVATVVPFFGSRLRSCTV